MKKARTWRADEEDLDGGRVSESAVILGTSLRAGAHGHHISTKGFHCRIFFNFSQPAEQQGYRFVEFGWGQLFEDSEQLYFHRRIHAAAPYIELA